MASFNNCGPWLQVSWMHRGRVMCQPVFVPQNIDCFMVQSICSSIYFMQFSLIQLRAHVFILSHQRLLRHQLLIEHHLLVQLLFGLNLFLLGFAGVLFYFVPKFLNLIKFFFLFFSEMGVVLFLQSCHFCIVSLLKVIHIICRIRIISHIPRIISS